MWCANQRNGNTFGGVFALAISESSIVNMFNFIFIQPLFSHFIVHCTMAVAHNVPAAWRSGGGTQRFGRETNFQSPTKLSANHTPTDTKPPVRGRHYSLQYSFVHLADFIYRLHTSSLQ